MTGSIYGECLDLVNESHGYGITTVAPNGDNGLDITTAAPIWTTASGTVHIEGTWPNLIITDTGAPGGGAPTYSFNSGAGIEVTGGPVDFTFSLKPTGIIAGDYGPVSFNTFGQATAVGQILSSVTGNNGITAVVEPLTGAVVLTMDDASNASPGVVTLYTTVGVEPYPNDVAITPAACQQLIDIELASIASGDSSVQLFFTPLPVNIDPASFANSTVLATSQIINVPAGTVLAISGMVKLASALDCQMLIVGKGVTDVFLGLSAVEMTDKFWFYGSINGPFSNQIEIRAYKLGAVAPIGGSALYANMSVS